MPNQTIIANKLKYAFRKVTGDDPDALQMSGMPKNLKGMDIYENKLVPAFMAKYQKWGQDLMDGVKGTPDEFPLFDAKTFDAWVDAQYPRSQREADALVAGREPPRELPGTPIPEAPQGVSKGGWSTYMAKAPSTKDGTPLPHDIWGELLGQLVADPTPENRAAWNKYFDASGFPADKVLADLRPASVQKPENVGNAPPAGQELTSEDLEDREFDEMLQSIPGRVSKHLPKIFGIFNPLPPKE